MLSVKIFYEESEMRKYCLNGLLGCLLGASMHTNVWAQQSPPEAPAETPAVEDVSESVEESANEVTAEEEAQIRENHATARVRYESLMKRRAELETAVRDRLKKLLDKYRPLPLLKPLSSVTVMR